MIKNVIVEIPKLNPTLPSTLYTEFQPFGAMIAQLHPEEKEVLQSVTIRVDKWYAPPEFFDKCKVTYEADFHGLQDKLPAFVKTPGTFANFINVILAIIDYFGFDVEYDPAFIKNFDNLTMANVYLYGYQTLQDKPLGKRGTIRFHRQIATMTVEELEDLAKAKTRRFHGVDYTEAEFLEKLVLFTKKYE